MQGCIDRVLDLVPEEDDAMHGIIGVSTTCRLAGVSLSKCLKKLTFPLQSTKALGFRR